MDGGNHGGAVTLLATRPDIHAPQSLMKFDCETSVSALCLPSVSLLLPLCSGDSSPHLRTHMHTYTHIALVSMLICRRVCWEEA